jgi:hypothetical protein
MKSWNELPEHVREAVMRDMESRLSEVFVQQTAAMKTRRAPGSDEDDGGITTRVATHTSHLLAGYNAALILLQKA